MPTALWRAGPVRPVPTGPAGAARPGGHRGRGLSVESRPVGSAAVIWPMATGAHIRPGSFFCASEAKISTW